MLPLPEVSTLAQCFFILADIQTDKERKLLLQGACLLGVVVGGIQHVDRAIVMMIYTSWMILMTYRIKRSSRERDLKEAKVWTGLLLEPSAVGGELGSSFK